MWCKYNKLCFLTAKNAKRRERKEFPLLKYFEYFDKLSDLCGYRISSALATVDPISAGDSTT